MLRGSEKEPEGGDKNGGGNGLGALFANSASPVSNRKGGISLCNVGVSGVAEVENVNSGRHLGRLSMRDLRGCGRMARTICGRRTDLLIPASWIEDGLKGCWMWQLERDLLFLDVPPTDKPRGAGILVERALAERPPYECGSS